MNRVTIAHTQLTSPIAVFDAGIGSYSAVRTLRDRYPQQDILYFADRANFPYGEKSIEQLRDIVRGTLEFLTRKGAAGIVVASNVPSVTVLDGIRDCVPVPVVGVVPPLRKALSEAEGGHVAILGARSMIDSAELRKFIGDRAGDQARRVSAHNASSLIEVVENGMFLTHPDAASRVVREFMGQIASEHADLRSVTLSSTHLPWLRPLFEESQPTLKFFDPIEEILPEIGTVVSAGSGKTVGMVSGSPRYPAADFPPMLEKLGISIPLEFI